MKPLNPKIAWAAIATMVIVMLKLIIDLWSSEPASWTPNETNHRYRQSPAHQ